MQPQDLTCPSHGGTEAVQKVSAIVAMGTSEGSFSGPSGGLSFDSEGKVGSYGGYTTLSGSGQTLLAKKLAAPKEPTYIGTTESDVKFAQGCGIFFLLVGALFLPIFLLADERSRKESAVLGILMILLSGGCGGWLLSYVSHLRSTLVADQQRFAPILAAWERAMARWNALFYCWKCDVVFVPGEGTFAPSGQMRQYIEPPEEPPTSLKPPEETPSPLQRQEGSEKNIDLPRWWDIPWDRRFRNR